MIALVFYQREKLPDRPHRQNRRDRPNRPNPWIMGLLIPALVIICLYSYFIGAIPADVLEALKW